MKLNPNEVFVKKIKNAIKNNDGYCPCFVVKDEDTKCPCKEQRENGICHCGLFIN